MSGPVLIDMSAALARIGAAGRVVITTHARADGDALGCVAAMVRMLAAQGKKATGMIHEAAPPRYAFVSEAAPLGVWTSANAGAIGECDLMLVVDTCSSAQLGDVAGAIAGAKAARLAIDHHVTRDSVVAEAWVDESAAACAQMITRLADGAGWPIDPQTATLLFTALATDTGWFRFSNATSATYMTAARLIHAGARPNELYERLFLGEIEPRMRLAGAILSTFELRAGGRLAIVKVTREMLARCGATTAMTEDLINEPQRLASVDTCVMLTEPEDGGPVRVSFRSKHLVDVAAVAARFGGGGHARAAGAKVKGQFANVCDEVVRAVEACFK